MRVAIDIRRAGDYGLGTYIRNIVNQLARIDSDSNYLLIGKRSHLAEFDPLPPNFELLEYPHEPGTLSTHLHLPWLLRQRRVDALHMPWFYAPAIVPARLFITVHDLTDVLTPPAGVAASSASRTPVFRAPRAEPRRSYLRRLAVLQTRSFADLFDSGIENQRGL